MAKVKKQTKPQRTATHRFGAHLSIAGGMHKAIEAALTCRFETVQVFVKNQRQWKATPLQPDDVARWHKLRETPGFGPVVAHATYLINLGSADAALFTRSRDALTEELLRCDELAIEYLVVHPGSAKDSTVNAAIERVVRAIDHIYAENAELKTTLLLETTAGQGATLGRSFAELGAIRGALRAPERVGICIDTCHVFAAGYDIRTPAGYAGMIAEAEREVGLDTIRCWHFNDSKGTLGAHLDRHEHIGHGEIGVAGFRNVVHDGRFAGVPMILETPKGEDERGRDWDKVNVRRLRSIAAATSKRRGR